MTQPQSPKRDHGGDLDRAKAEWGDAGDWPGPWIDLSTGINRQPWPVPALSAQAWQALPEASAVTRLQQVAAERFCCNFGQVLPVAGASAAIQLVPGLRAPGRAAVLWPSYNEHGAALRAAGWQVDHVPALDDLIGADLAVVVNPNNPNGHEYAPESLRELAGRVGFLIVDESFCDPRPDLSISSDIPRNTLVMRSFGKFWGLAGLRLGFTLGTPDLLTELAERAGPWSVSGPALEIGAQALADHEWAIDATWSLAEGANLLDSLAFRAGWSLVGGTHLFRTYHTPDAAATQATLAQHRIWSRIFPYSRNWLRLGIPARHEWSRVTTAITTP
ncbi:MAG: threonine-phosphate decarboxylase CobD [Paracoccus sp. (in: a-proteobacteria)]|uniref:threonine-phosphate decarboxylase CobD n=1 Tax=Paracoccus sp. TaxID=267 RepID=UPI0026DF9CDF|nr:threonine-phosphate decarboxylase CobD [Paracoccus sp. (in: a-proteobacteria)]MDO5622206.1 threonine-phosphate decarboxylase CobD [Paracoccus sp. (in: a-proteobacteria)]